MWALAPEGMLDCIADLFRVSLKDPGQKDLWLMSDFGPGAARRLYTRTAPQIP